MRAAVDLLNSSLSKVAAGLRELGFDGDQLEPGECEVAMLIPLTEQNRAADRVAADIAFADGAVKLLSELAGEGRPNTRVRALASSDFLIYIYATVEVARHFGEIVDFVLQMHERVKKLHSLAEEILELGGPEAPAEEIKSGVVEQIEEQLDELTESISQQAVLDDSGRVVELRTEIKRTVRGMAARIDNGYRFDIRAELPSAPEADGDEDAAELDAGENAFSRVRELSSSITYSPLVTHPILELPEPGRYVEDSDE